MQQDLEAKDVQGQKMHQALNQELQGLKSCMQDYQAEFEGQKKTHQQ